MGTPRTADDPGPVLEGPRARNRPPEPEVEKNTNKSTANRRPGMGRGGGGRVSKKRYCLFVVSFGSSESLRGPLKTLRGAPPPPPPRAGPLNSAQPAQLQSSPAVPRLGRRRLTSPWRGGCDAARGARATHTR
eukprot:2697708-Pyramimonas_sp.AAC.1